MTADGLAGDVLVAGSGAEVPGAAIAAAPILVMCDRLLGEIGRRSHLFGWLREPGAGPQQWLPVDAYYPGNRLVVLYREEPSPHDRLYGELVPAHGLRLLWLRPADLVRDPAGPQAAIQRMIAELGELRRAVPREPPEDQVRESVVARAVASFSQPVKPVAQRPQRLAGSRAAAAERAARFVSERKVLEERSPSRKWPEHRSAPARLPSSGRPAPAQRSRPARPTSSGRPAPAPRPPRPVIDRRDHPAWPLPAPTLLVVLALAGVLCAEIYVGVEEVALSAGHVLLAFGIALDGCARALGTIAAARAGRRGWAWLCVVGGSPVVATFALFQSAGPVDVEPAPLAGLISILASAVVAIALLAGLLGI